MHSVYPGDVDLPERRSKFYHVREEVGNGGDELKESLDLVSSTEMLILNFSSARPTQKYGNHSTRVDRRVHK